MEDFGLWLMAKVQLVFPLSKQGFSVATISTISSRENDCSRSSKSFRGWPLKFLRMLTLHKSLPLYQSRCHALGTSERRHCSEPLQGWYVRGGCSLPHSDSYWEVPERQNVKQKLRNCISMFGDAGCCSTSCSPPCWKHQGKPPSLIQKKVSWII